jgi:hypothetical protein
VEKKFKDIKFEKIKAKCGHFGEFGYANKPHGIFIPSHDDGVDMASKQDLEEFEYRLTIKLAAILGGTITRTLGIVTILMKLR